MTPLETLHKVLNEIEWEPEPDETVTGFHVDFGPPYLPVSSAFAAVANDTQQFVCYLNFGACAAPDRRDEVARFIARANWGLMIGNFEMDFEDGHVRFKSSLDYSGAELTENLIRNAILSAMNAMEKYAGALLAVLTAKKNAVKAVEEIENSRD